MEPRVKNAADEQQVKRAEKRGKVENFQKRDDLLWVLSDRKGRRFVWRVLSLCGVFSECMGSDPQWTSFNLGRRAIGTTIYKEIAEIDPLILGHMGHEEQKETEMTHE